MRNNEGLGRSRQELRFDPAALETATEHQSMRTWQRGKVSDGTV